MPKFSFFKFRYVLFTLALLGGLIALATAMPASGAGSRLPALDKGAPSGGPAVPASDPAMDGPFVGKPVLPTLTVALRDLPEAKPEDFTGKADDRQIPLSAVLNYHDFRNITDVVDPLASLSDIHSSDTPLPTLTFDGGQNTCSCSPPDVSGDVGPNHYVQMVNSTIINIYNKSGTVLVANRALKSLWTSGNCASSTRGDPVVVYDKQADRWVLAQFSTGNGMCIAVSQTADPTGAYYGYEFTTPALPDYFKIGVWGDAYYIGANESTYVATAVERSRMLSGLSAQNVRFTGETNFILPADLDGPTAPPAGAPGLFYTFKDDAQHGGVDRLEVFALAANWTTPASSTFTKIATLNITPFTYTVCGFFSMDCLPQGGTTQKLDPVSEWPMWRFSYRNFGSYQTLLGDFTVDVGSDRAGIRWFELRNTSGTWNLYQEGTNAPSDGLHRWMGSIAMDKNGGIAMGYTTSGTSLAPSLRIASRASTDALGTLQTEATFYAGGGFQSGSNRWGDYSTMSIDPSDDCTFWYTAEYLSSASSSVWRSRIGKFTLPTCTTGPTPTFTPTSTPGGPTPTFTPTATPVSVTNDDFNGATVLSALPYTGNATTTSYTTATDDPALCAGTPATGAHSVWFKYTPGANNTLALDTFTSGYDTVLAVFTGARGSLTRLACNDDAASGTQSQITGLAVTAGTTYYIEIAAYGSGAGGATVLHVSGTTTVTNTPTSTPVVVTNTPTRTPTAIVITNTPTATATGIACPNLAGTYCRTNNEARTWIAGSTSTSITGDDQAAAVTLPFAFNFMGTSYTSINISSNGNAHFGTSSTAYSNVAVPGTGAPNAMIAAFWDDLDPAAGGAIYTAVSGTAPNRTFTIEWRDVRAYNTGTSGITFEIQLVETSNHIWVLYQDTVFGSTTIDAGLSATSGIENSGGTAGNQYSFNSAALANGLVLHYWKP